MPSARAHAKFTAVYEKHGRWYVGYVREVPGANTQGRTLKEVKDNLRDALDLILTTRRVMAGNRTPPGKVIRESITVRVR